MKYYSGQRRVRCKDKDVLGFFCKTQNFKDKDVLVFFVVKHKILWQESGDQLVGSLLAEMWHFTAFG